MLRWCVGALVSAAFAIQPAAAGGEHGGDAAARARRATERLERFSAERRLEADVRMREVSRDASRRAEERRLRATGSPRDLAAYRERVDREERLEELRIRHELREPEGSPPPGPVTRRVFERSGLAFRRFQRELDLDARLRALEDETEAPPQPFEPVPSLGMPKATE